MHSRADDPTFRGFGAPATSHVVREVDTRGTYCPGPLLEAIRLIRECTMGETIAVVTGDPASGSSIPAWVARAGHTLTGAEDMQDGRRYLITRNR